MVSFSAFYSYSTNEQQNAPFVNVVKNERNTPCSRSFVTKTHPVEICLAGKAIINETCTRIVENVDYSPHTGCHIRTDNTMIY